MYNQFHIEVKFDLSYCRISKNDEHDDEMADEDHAEMADEEHDEMGDEDDGIADEEDDEVHDEVHDEIHNEEDYEISDEEDYENEERDSEGQDDFFDDALADFEAGHESKTSLYRTQISSFNKNDLLTMTNCIVNTNQLLQLAQAPTIITCNRDDCQSQVTIESKYHGTRVVLQWVSIYFVYNFFNMYASITATRHISLSVSISANLCSFAVPAPTVLIFYFSLLQVCENHHICQIWESQPMLNFNMSAVDFVTAFAILSSGNSFRKIYLFAKFANLNFISESAYHRLQKYIFIPAIDTFWKKHQKDLAKSLLGQNLVLLGESTLCVKQVLSLPNFRNLSCIYIFLLLLFR